VIAAIDVTAHPLIPVVDLQDDRNKIDLPPFEIHSAITKSLSGAASFVILPFHPPIRLLIPAGQIDLL
jgi:hypothetical protein